MLRTIFLLSLLAALAAAQNKTPRLVEVEDVHRIKALDDPQVSPDGQWVAYTVKTSDLEADKTDTDVWMVRWDGSESLRLTTSKEPETSPRWSPDGRWLAFLSTRGAPDAGSQVWLLHRSGGEAQQLTSVKGSVNSFAWAPDSQRMALVVREKEEEEKGAEGKPKTKKPIEITRYRFKDDDVRYRTAGPDQIWLFTLDGKKLERLTAENFEEAAPAWSPDGSLLAFYSNRGETEEHRYQRWVLCTAESKPGATVVEEASVDSRIRANRVGDPVWSDDGTRLFFLAGGDLKQAAYMRLKLAQTTAGDGSHAVQVREPAIDRSLSLSRPLSTGGLGFLVIDDMSQYPVRAQPDGSGWAKLFSDKGVVSAWDEAAGRLAVLLGSDTEPEEIYALEEGKARRLTAHNVEWRSQVKLAEAREIRFHAKDGPEVHALLTLPPDSTDGQKLPLLLRIHGGPNQQEAHAFHLERQLFAAHGYAVLQVNYRGSAGREEAFQTAIYADWGNKEVADLLAGVDHVVQLGIADPERLGIGGWSYGGILTNYTIATDTRFRAATSGAGSSLQFSMYGVDQYIDQWDLEVGQPWKARDLWLKLSYPFFEADKIKTPTLFLGGENDFNVPVSGSEQMYQALRAGGVPSELVIYPGERHGITKPSYVQHRLERYLAWYAKYLGKDGMAANTPSGLGTM